MQALRDVHWTPVKRIIHYLKHIIFHGLLIHQSSSSQLFLYSDANWVGCPNDQKSTSGYCIFLNRNHLSLISKKQPTVLRSSIKSEYKALTNGTAEILWLQSLFCELGIALSTTPFITMILCYLPFFQSCFSHSHKAHRN